MADFSLSQQQVRSWTLASDIQLLEALKLFSNSIAQKSQVICLFSSLIFKIFF